MIRVAKVKIIVLKKIDPKTVFGEAVSKNPMTREEFEKCAKFEEGQEFIVENCGEMPSGFGFGD